MNECFFGGWIKNIFLSWNVFSFVFWQVGKGWKLINPPRRWFSSLCDIISFVVWNWVKSFFPGEIVCFFSLRFLPVCGKAVLVCTLGLLLCLGWAAMICWGFLAAGQSRGTLTFSFAFSRFKTFLSPSLRTKDKMYQLQIWIHQDINSRHLSTQNFSWCLDL